jgi:hypothetical protein
VLRWLRGWRADKVAVGAAISLRWSNAQTEGEITKLKRVKQQDVRARQTRPTTSSPPRSRIASSVIKIASEPSSTPIDVLSSPRFLTSWGRVGAGGPVVPIEPSQIGAADVVVTRADAAAPAPNRNESAWRRVCGDLRGTRAGEKT